jgi:hypothetical protein
VKTCAQQPVLCLFLIKVSWWHSEFIEQCRIVGADVDIGSCFIRESDDNSCHSRQLFQRHMHRHSRVFIIEIVRLNSHPSCLRQMISERLSHNPIVSHAKNRKKLIQRNVHGGQSVSGFQDQRNSAITGQPSKFNVGCLMNKPDPVVCSGRLLYIHSLNVIDLFCKIKLEIRFITWATYS